MAHAGGGGGAGGGQGAQGPPGAQGFQGAPGAQGSQGAVGAQGAAGPQGAQGFQGSVGAQGPAGAQGSVGAQGAQGFQGQVGAQGAQGSQGSVGAQGATGAQGSQGTTGAQGSQGTTGAQGAQGGTGAQGAAGGTGAQGAQGAQGSIQTLVIYSLPAGTMDFPNTADWAVATPSALDVDSSNSSIGVRDMVQGSENGVGVESLYIPTGTTQVKLDFWMRSPTSPGGTRHVGLKLYQRETDNDTPIPAWSSTVLNDVVFPNDTNYQKFTQTISLVTLGITAGSLVQFQLDRVTPASGVELATTAYLRNWTLEFS